jgi:hypothetical protein
MPQSPRQDVNQGLGARPSSVPAPWQPRRESVPTSASPDRRWQTTHEHRDPAGSGSCSRSVWRSPQGVLRRPHPVKGMPAPAGIPCARWCRGRLQLEPWLSQESRNFSQFANGLLPRHRPASRQPCRRGRGADARPRTPRSSGRMAVVPRRRSSRTGVRVSEHRPVRGHPLNDVVRGVIEQEHGQHALELGGADPLLGSRRQREGRRPGRGAPDGRQGRLQPEPGHVRERSDPRDVQHPAALRLPDQERLQREVLRQGIPLR